MPDSPPQAPPSPPPQPPHHPPLDSQEPDTPIPNPSINPNPTQNPIDDEQTQLTLDGQQQSDEPEPEPEGMDITLSPEIHTKPSKGSTVRRKRKKGTKNYMSHAALERRLHQLSRCFKPIPFVPCKSLEFSKHEVILKKLGLWDFAHIDFDRNIRVDLVMNLIVDYNVKNRGSYVNGVKIGVSRADLARALKLPLPKKGDRDAESFPVEFLGFLDEFVSKWMLLHEDPWVMPSDILNYVKLIKEGSPHKVDWAGMIWCMMEKELGMKTGLKDCYYASHLQHLVKVQKEELFSESKDEEMGSLVAGGEGLRETVAVDDDDEDEDDGGDVKMVDVEEVEKDIGGLKVEEMKNVELKLGGDSVGEVESVGGVEEVEKDGDCRADNDAEKVEEREEAKVEDVEKENVEDVEKEKAEDVQNEKFEDVQKEMVEENDIGKFEDSSKDKEEHDFGKFEDISNDKEEHDFGKFEDISNDKEEHDIRMFEDLSKDKEEHDFGKFEDISNDKEEHDIRMFEDLSKDKEEHEIKNVEDVNEKYEDDIDEGKKMEVIETTDVVANVDNIENMVEEIKDEEMTDYGDYKGEQLGQGQWLFDGRNNEGKPFLQRCTGTDVNASTIFEDVGEDVDDDEVEEDDEAEGFKILQKGPMDGMTSANLMHSFETGQVPFTSNELGGQSSLELMTARAENNMMLGEPSMFNHPGKREIDHDDDISHQVLNDNHKRMRIDGNWDNKVPEFDVCAAQLQYWVEKAKMSHHTANQDAYQQLNMTQSFYAQQLSEKDNQIAHWRYKCEELNRGKQVEIDRLNRELYLMNSVIDGYRKALKQTQRTFADYRMRCQVPDEPIYKDAGPGGVVKSVMELERERLKQEEENKRVRNFMEQMFMNFMNEFEVKCIGMILEKVEYQHSRLGYAVKEVELLKDYRVKQKKAAIVENDPEAPLE